MWILERHGTCQPTAAIWGGTEEGYMVFRSYRYVSDPDIAGRYTFLQVFNDKGEMVDSLDLEHVKLKEYQDEEKAD